MHHRILILTPSTLAEQEPDFIAACQTSSMWGQRRSVAGAYAYAESHQVDIAALHPEMTPLEAWADFAGSGLLPGKSGVLVPVFTCYVVPVVIALGVSSAVKVGPINARILNQAVEAGKPVYFLVCGAVTTQVVDVNYGLTLEGRDTLRLGVKAYMALTSAVEAVLLADEKAAAEVAAAEGEE